MARKTTLDAIVAGNDILAANDAAAEVAARQPREMLDVAIGNVSLSRAKTGNAQLSIGIQVNGAKTAHVYLSLTDAAYAFTVAKLERAWDAVAPDALFELVDERERIDGIVEWLKPLTKPTSAQAFVTDDGDYELPWGRRFEVLF